MPVRNSQLLVGGRWQEASDGGTLVATNPATASPIGSVAAGTADDVDGAVRAARTAFEQHRDRSPWERAAWCDRIGDAIEAHADDLALLLATEQGKPFHTEAKGEVGTAVRECRQAAQLIRFMESEVIPLADPNKRAFVTREGRGVYAVITPWNFPLGTPMSFLAGGLVSGNAMVWVPAPTTSLVSARLAELMVEADLPAGLVNLVTGLGPVVGDAAVVHPGTDAVAFTGSVATGRIVASRAAGKPIVLELGGNGPTIVLDDADVDAAIQATAASCWYNAGQSCIAGEIILAQPAVVDQLAEGIAASTVAITLGDPTDARTTMGPLNNDPVARKMDRHMADAVERGAEVLCGGRRAPELGSPLFFEPTVLRGVAADSFVALEESFGPVAPILAVADEGEALAAAARAGYGLFASVWTRSARRAHAVASRLRAGTVNINASSDFWESHLPFGGASGTQSGVGRAGGRATIEAMSDHKTVTIDYRHM
jgi:acyl-CoA reductase-like NAD-dependent aldehyde dehydrogenase